MTKERSPINSLDSMFPKRNVIQQSVCSVVQMLYISCADPRIWRESKYVCLTKITTEHACQVPKCMYQICFTKGMRFQGDRKRGEKEVDAATAVGESRAGQGKGRQNPPQPTHPPTWVKKPIPRKHNLLATWVKKIPESTLSLTIRKDEFVSCPFLFCIYRKVPLAIFPICFSLQ